MPPAPGGPPPVPAPSGASNPNHTPSKWNKLQTRANVIGSITALFLCLMIGGGIVGYFLAQARKPAPAAKSPSIETLTPAELSKLGEIGANLGTSNQVLNIAADALFRGKANVVGDFTVGGHLNANGPVTLSQLNITGTTAATGLSVGSNLNVTGSTTLQKALTVNDLTTVNSNLTVSGQISAGGINAGSISVHTLSLSGPITIAHLATGGPVPFFAGGADGSGGTVSISGNDTAGTININTGSGPGANATLITVTFRAAYSSTVHVLLTPRTAAAASAQAYVVPTSSNFRVLANTPGSGSILSYDYFVTQ